MIHFYSVWRGIPNDQLLEMFESDGYDGLPMIAIDVKQINDKIIIGRREFFRTRSEVRRKRTQTIGKILT